jgi:5-methyltetrahydropteroyltriglutamate--homocysteine methyltransferase
MVRKPGYDHGELNGSFRPLWHIPMANPLRTTVVGSYPVPEWLRVLPTSGNLRDAVLVVLKTQELAGIDVISDGELSRFDVNHPETNGMIDYFVRPLGGVATAFRCSELEAFRRKEGFGFRARPAGVVRGPIDEGTLDLPAAWDAVKDLAARPLKFTVTSPYMLARTLLDAHYGDLRALVLAIADVLAGQVEPIDAAIVQVDEANLPGRPQDAPIAAEGINRVLARARGEKAVHLCFGNYGGQTIQRGFFRDLLPFFNALECDHLVLEFARRGYDELDVFRDLKPGIALGVGVVDIKDNEVETPDEIARRVERAVSVLGAERVKWIHPDCGFWMLQRSVADRKLRALAAGAELVVGANES